MSKDFYITNIFPYRGIIIKICRAYSNSQEDYEDYYQEVCLQIWKSRENFKNKSEWSTWVYRISLNVCLSLLRKQKKYDEGGNMMREVIQRERKQMRTGKGREQFEEKQYFSYVENSQFDR